VSGVDWIPEIRPCPVCGRTVHDPLGTRGGRAHSSGLGAETLVVRCQGCHAVYGRPCLLPTTNPYRQHSTDEYFRVHETTHKTDSGRALADHASSILGRKGRMLELGCGRGDLLAGAMSAGWTVRGVEMTDAFAEVATAAGFSIEVARVETCHSLDEQWDTILLAAVLEHLYEPRDCLIRVFNALVPGGVAFIDVPNECSFWTRVGNAYMRARGRSWAVNLSPTFPPYHVVGFCPRSLRYLADAIGFDIVDLRTHRWHNDLPARRSLIGRLESLGAEVALSLGARVGSGAGITAWLRRPLVGSTLAGTPSERARRHGKPQ
jgi:2-polyprenyl-3-methyl-5-hydroxy-6-metoxy-1,4-benzoquinol methylase